MSIQKEKELAQRRRLRRMEQERQNRCLDALFQEIEHETLSQDRRISP